MWKTHSIKMKFGKGQNRLNQLKNKIVNDTRVVLKHFVWMPQVNLKTGTKFLSEDWTQQRSSIKAALVRLRNDVDDTKWRSSFVRRPLVDVENVFGQSRHSSSLQRFNICLFFVANLASHDQRSTEDNFRNSFYVGVDIHFIAKNPVLNVIGVGTWQCL